MWEYYCPTCKKNCDKEEIELREWFYEGDWEETHILCDTKVKVTLSSQKL